MPAARTHSVALAGVDGHRVEIDAGIENGPPGLLLTGLPDTAAREAGDRVKAAVISSGQQWPQRRVTVTLSPASLPKPGTSFDLGIAVAVLAAAGALPAAAAGGVAFLGELGPGGRLEPVRGVLPAVAAAALGGFRVVAVPLANAAEASLAGGVEVIAAATLAGLLGRLRGDLAGDPADPAQV